MANQRRKGLVHIGAWISEDAKEKLLAEAERREITFPALMEEVAMFASKLPTRHATSARGRVAIDRGERRPEKNGQQGKKN